MPARLERKYDRQLDEVKLYKHSYFEILRWEVVPGYGWPWRESQGS